MEICVSIVMITYNHEPYIAEAIEGVLMQKCSFPIELVIGEDYSNDNTRKICEEYANKSDLIKLLPTETNLGMMPNFIRTLQSCTGKYIALCEGDDYWTDPLKLQKQVDFLEANADYGLVHTQTKYTIDKTGEEKLSLTNRSKNTFADLIRKNSIATLTTCMRKELLLRYLYEINPSEKPWKAGDLPMWLWFSLNSKIHYLNEATSMYRVVAGSASNTIGSRDYFNFIKSRYNIKKEFITKYSQAKELEEYILKDFYKDAEFHALKLKEIETIVGIKNNYRSENNIIGAYYFKLMSIFIKAPILYLIFFNAYRVYYKFLKKHESYTM